MLIHTFVVGQMQANCYVCVDEKTNLALVIDPGDDGTFISDQLNKKEITPFAIVATHGHFDHIMATFELQVVWNIPFYLNTNDWFLLDEMQKSAKHFLGVKTDPPPQNPQHVKEADRLQFGCTEVSFIEVPGHTPGSIAVYHQESKSLFSGDVLFSGGGVGRTDFSYSNKNILEKSIKKIVEFPNDTRFYPGHGEVIPISLAREYFAESV